ncbi:MAG: class I SAM-dependent methyltransferase [Patescibacteria group bacterium]
MIVDACVCGEGRIFTTLIRYENETIFAAYEGLAIIRCTKCGLLKTSGNYKRINSKVSNTDFYESNQPIFSNYFRDVVERICRYQRSGRVLDVGCASGICMRVLSQNGFSVYGIEPNRTAYKIVKQKFPDMVFPLTLKKLWLTKKLRFHTIIYNHVLEHIPDIRNEFSYIHKALLPGGLLVIGVPNSANLVFWLRGKYWESLLPNQHIWHFSTKYLVQYLTSQGFTIFETSYNNHLRQDYPLVKRLYFKLLTILNTLFSTGEAVVIFAKKKESQSQGYP